MSVPSIEIVLDFCEGPQKDHRREVTSARRQVETDLQGKASS